MSLSLRVVDANDEGFLFQVYAGTRAPEMELVDWSAEQKQAFLQMQYNAQRQSYLQQFPKAEYHIILRNDVGVGRLIVDRSDDFISLMDIAILPEHRNSGIGSAFIKALQVESAETNKPLQLHVETFNPALSLYEKLGFTKIGEVGFYWQLEWRAESDATMTSPTR
jgi:ribosomal protein S18 acetylase RimI-like enzyme